jgi:hypothetical protein
MQFRFIKRVKGRRWYYYLAEVSYEGRRRTERILRRATWMDFETLGKPLPRSQNARRDLSYGILEACFNLFTLPQDASVKLLEEKLAAVDCDLDKATEQDKLVFISKVGDLLEAVRQVLGRYYFEIIFLTYYSHKSPIIVDRLKKAEKILGELGSKHRPPIFHAVMTQVQAS